MTRNLTRAITEKQFLEKLGRIIQHARVQKGFGQEDLAFKMDVTRTTISNWECGRKNMTVSQLWKLSRVLDTSLEISFHGKPSSILEKVNKNG